MTSPAQPLPNPFQAIPYRWRKRLYGVFAVASLVFAVLTAAYAKTQGGELPNWLEVGNDVLPILGAAFGFTAMANVSPTRPADPHQLCVRCARATKSQAAG